MWQVVLMFLFCLTFIYLGEGGAVSVSQTSASGWVLEIELRLSGKYAYLLSSQRPWYFNLLDHTPDQKQHHCIVYRK